MTYTKTDLEIMSKTYTTNKFGNFVVRDVYKDKKYYRYLVEFIETGYTTLSLINEIRVGRIKDYLKPIIYDVGCLGYADKKGNEKQYRIWHNIIERCYCKTNKDYHNYGQRGVFVCERWLRFEYFLEDFSKIEGYDLDLIMQNKVHLDKDCKIEGNLEYCLNNCKFVSVKENIRNTRCSKKFKAISPQGTEYITLSQTEMSEIINIPNWRICLCLKNKKTHNGWNFQYI